MSEKPKYINERRKNMKIVLIRSPGIIAPLLRKFFGIRKKK